MGPPSQALGPQARDPKAKLGDHKPKLANPKRRLGESKPRLGDRKPRLGNSRLRRGLSRPRLGVPKPRRARWSLRPGNEAPGHAWLPGVWLHKNRSVEEQHVEICSFHEKLLR